MQCAFICMYQGAAARYVLYGCTACHALQHLFLCWMWALCSTLAKHLKEEGLCTSQVGGYVCSGYLCTAVSTTEVHIMKLKY
jgi:hypothetical protein